MPQPHDSRLSIELAQVADRPLYFDQYFGLWAVESARFLQMLDHVGHMDLRSHVALHAGDASISAAKVRQEANGDAPAIAVLEIQGTLTKRGSSLSSAGSMVRLRQAIRTAARDPEIGGILLRIDSPGGTVAGTADLAREVAAAAAKKPVYAFAEDLTASAAYWVASQCDKIYANHATAVVGSIGTFVGLYDCSAMAAKEGVKAIVIKSGKYKGAGFAGTEITDEQRAYWQQIVDKTQGEFSAAISAGRKLPLPRVEELADGRIHTAPDAKTLGLIDGIQSFDETLAELAERVRGLSSKSNPRKQIMSEEQHLPIAAAAPRPASYDELKTECLGADSAFLCGQLDAKATLPQARAAWMSEQQSRLAAATNEAKDAKAAARAGSLGVEPLGGGAGKSPATVAGDPVAAFHDAVASKVAAGMKRDKAVVAVVHENPELHDQFVAAVNADRPQRRR
jgi:signal peptide peptidase SppA